MHHSHSLHIFHYDVKQMKYLFVSAAIRLFGGGLLSLFSALLVFRMFEDPVQGFINVLWFFFVHSLVIVLMNILVVHRCIHRRGTKLSMIIGTAFLILYQLALYRLGDYTGSIVMPAMLLGFFTAFFRSAFHFNVTHNTKTKKFGEKIALLNIIVTVTLALGPLLGGFLLESYGVGMTVIISSCIVGCSIIPLLFSYKKHTDNLPLQVDMSVSLLKFLKNNRKKPLVLSFFAKGYIGFVGSVIWPLLIFIEFGSFTKVGGIIALTTTISVVLLYATGKVLTKHKETKLMKRTIGVQVLTWISGIIAVFGQLLTGTILSLIDLMSKFTEKINTTCIEKSFYEGAGSKKSHLYQVILHDISLHLPRMVIYGSSILLLSFFPLDLNIIFTFFLGVLIFILPLQYGIFFRKK